jgi:hypothetical protein
VGRITPGSQPPWKERAVPDLYTQFLRQQNIRDFEDRLTVETDPAKRELLMKLLAEERAGKLSPLPTIKP